MALNSLSWNRRLTDPAATTMLSTAGIDNVTVVSVDVDIGAAEKYTEAIVLLLLLIIASLGNLLLWLSVLNTKRLRKQENYFVLCLSLADLLVSVVNMPFTVIAIVAESWMFSDLFCVAQGFTNMVTFVASVLSLAAITGNRYMAVCYWERYKEVYTQRKTILMCIGM